MLNLQKNSINDVLVLSLEGKVDTETSPDLREVVFDVIDNGARRIVIDCSGMTYISSAGLRVLMLISSKLKPLGGSLGLSNIRSDILTHLENAGFIGFFEIYQDNDEATA